MPRFQRHSDSSTRNGAAVVHGRFDRMTTYAGFGFRIESDFDLPELDRAEASSDPTWRFEQRPNRLEETSPGRLLGTDDVYEGVTVSAFATPDSVRLVYDDTGTFEILKRQRTIVHYRHPSASVDAIRADLLGRVIAFAALVEGRLALHASAVVIDGRAIALLGPKGAGKSTLALALVRLGARLITDDTLVAGLDVRGRPWTWPGVQRVRLWSDSVSALGAAPDLRAGAKPTLSLGTEQRQFEPVPLDACYILCPVAASETDVRCDRLSAVQAAMSCVGFSKLGNLAGGDEGVAVFDRSTLLTRAVPFHSMEVPRDFARLPDVADAILAWHRARASAAPNVTVGC
jgi:hypothetical protein